MNMSKAVSVAACVTENFSHLVKAYVERSTYQNTSDLIRAILRDEIKREDPDLYQRFTRGDTTGSGKKGVIEMVEKTGEEDVNNI